MMPIVEMLAGVSWRLFTLTKTLNPLKAGMPETLTQKLTCAPLTTAAWLEGATKTAGVVAAFAGGNAAGDSANTTTNTENRRTAARGSLEFLLVLPSSNNRA